MQRTSWFLISAFLMISVGHLAVAEVKTFKTVPNDKKNVVQFTSKATLETVNGKTPNIVGQLDLNLDSIMATTNGNFTVDLTTLESGISMRDNDMKAKFLETDKFPNAVFVLKKFVSSDKPGLKLGETAHAVAQGDFTLHGVTKSYEVPVTLIYTATNAETTHRMYGNTGNALAVSAQWTVKLADHNIAVPELLFMRLSPDQKCDADFVMSDAPAPDAPAPK
jgi:polyisoprenoid-binding protein YceI